MELRICPITGQEVVSPKVYEDTITYDVSVHGQQWRFIIISSEKWDQAFTKVHQFVFCALIFNREWPIDQDVPITIELLQRIMRANIHPRVDKIDEKLGYFLKGVYKRSNGRFIYQKYYSADYYYAFAVNPDDFVGVIQVAEERNLIKTKKETGWENGFEIVLTGKGSEQAAAMIAKEISMDKIKHLSPGPRIIFVYHHDDEKWYHRINKEFNNHIDGHSNYVLHDNFSQNGKNTIKNYQQNEVIFIYILSRSFRQNNQGGILLDVSNEDPYRPAVNRNYYVFIDDTGIKDLPYLVDNMSQCYDFRQNYNRPQLLLAILSAWKKMLSLEKAEVESQESRPYDEYYARLPVIGLDEPTRLWLEIMWNRRLNFDETNRQELNSIIAKDFWSYTNFSQSNVSSLLCQSDLPTPYSWWLLRNGDTFYFDLIDKVIGLISEEVKEGRINLQVGNSRIALQLKVDVAQVTYVMEFLMTNHSLFDQTKKSGKSTLFRLSSVAVDFLRKYPGYIALFLENREKQLLDIKKKEDIDNSELAPKEGDEPKMLTTPLDGFSNANIHIRDSANTFPVLDVDHLAIESARIIHDMDNQEGLYGVFGNWGRGKTYLIERIIKTLKEDQKTKEYVVVHFDAWKYQDNPASWAFLYESISAKLYASVGFLGRQWKTIRFNWLRRKRPQNYLAFGAVVSIGVSLPLFSTANWLVGLFVSLGIPFVTAIIFTFRLNIKAKQFIRQMTTHTSYKEHLGIQNLIEKDLQHLLKAFVKKRNLHKKGVLLIVDNLDRCSEKKMIDLIDSLRVILEDKNIQERIKIITAIDENLLTTALLSRYKGVLNLQAKNKQVKNAYNGVLSAGKIVPDYLDKVFVSGVKLNKVTAKGRGQMMAAVLHKDLGLTDDFDEYHEQLKDDIMLNSSGFLFFGAREESPANKEEENDPPKYNGEPTYDGGQTYENPSMGGTTESITVEVRKKDGKIEESPQPAIEKKSNLTREEIKLLFHYARQNFEFTPRKARIIYYRYKLTKNLLFRFDNNNEYWTKREHLEILVYLLMHYSCSIEKYKEMEQKRVKCSNGEDYHVSYFEHNIPSGQAVLLFNILETVIIF